MNALIVSLFCAAALNTECGARTQADTADVYIINGREIEHFDGSQLTGKTVSSYEIVTENKCRIHRITAEPGINERMQMLDERLKNLKGTIERVKDDTLRIYYGIESLSVPLMIIDGEEKSHRELGGLEASDIASVEVYKPGSEKAAEYGDKGKNGVIYITTKNAKNMFLGARIIIDDIPATAEELLKIPPAKISSMTVYKRNSAENIKTTGDSLRDLIVIKLKDNK